MGCLQLPLFDKARSHFMTWVNVKARRRPFWQGRKTWANKQVCKQSVEPEGYQRISLMTQTCAVQGQDAEWSAKHNLWSCNEIQKITNDHAMKCNQDNDVTLNESINGGCSECKIQTLRPREEESELEIQTRLTREEYVNLRSKRVLCERISGVTNRCS